MMMLISYPFLQNYWWLIISLLGGLLAFLMFVQGGQSVIFSLPVNDTQKAMIVNVLGRKWEFTFTTLVTFGGAFFASFPLFYATSFGGAFWIWITILFSFVIQAIAYEYRSKPANILGKKTYDIFLFINGSLGPFLIGIAIATFFTGAQFSLDAMNQVKWANQWHGLEALLDARNLALGLTLLFLAKSNGLLFIINSVNDEKLINQAIKKLSVFSVSFLIFFLFFIISVFLSSGFAADSDTGTVVLEKYKYFRNIIRMPLVLVIFLGGVINVIYGFSTTIFRGSRKGIWFSGSGTILTVLSLFFVSGFNGTAFYPSLYDINSSLTIRNASSSFYTLKTMMYVSFLIPLVAVYIWYAWNAISRNKVTAEELKGEEHVY
jgi:cytochrome d ubiquinol oxidase subunit II